MKGKSAMIPRTLNKMVVFEVRSALQKHIRRGEERQAMHCAVEMGHTSKAFFTMLCNALEIISHEDIGLANPEAVMFTATAVEQAKRYFEVDKPGKWRMILGNAIRMLCRSKKSREGDHFQAAVGQSALMDSIAPTIPDYALDHHTHAGKKAGRDLTFFREVSTLLVPKGKPDDYEDEAYAIWKRKQQNGQPELW
jgi:replication-associated recombination protein RarA